MDSKLVNSNSLDKDTVNALVTALAAMLANKCIVERIVIGENTFDNAEQSQWPMTRLDKTTANYFRFFRESCLLHKIAKEDVEFRKAVQFIDKFFKAYETENESAISQLGILFFDGHIKQKTPEFLQYAFVIEEAIKESSLLNPSLTDEQREKSIAALKATFSLKRLLSSYRRTIAEACLESDMKFSTLEESIDAIIYATVLLTEKYLEEADITSIELESLWEPCGFFCDFWFAATLPDNDKNSQTIRQFFQKTSDGWPEYITNAMYILDYAAIIQDRLFSNRRMNPDTDWEKESYRIWNSYAAAALRLGEIFSKYKNKLPFMDDDIAMLRQKAKPPNTLIVTEGKTDWMHIKNALFCFHRDARFSELNLDFMEYEFSMGDEYLVRMCQDYAKMPQHRRVIFIADSDNPKVIEKLGAPSGTQYRTWGNNVFSFCLPVPAHREKYINISIEFYYSDDELKYIDEKTHKRLYFSNEVKKIVNENLTNGKVIVEYHTCPAISADEFNKKIYDDKCEKIVNAHGEQVAHSKAVFAENVYRQRIGYTNFNLEAFNDIFVIVQAICKNED